MLQPRPQHRKVEERLRVPEGMMGHVIGRGGSHIKAITSASGAHIKAVASASGAHIKAVASASGARLSSVGVDADVLVIRGTPQQVWGAHLM